MNYRENAMILIFLLLLTLVIRPATAQESKSKLLDWLQITPSAQSQDYVSNQQQFQLHTLLTEQRHPKTWSLSFRIKHNTAAGLEMLFGVDEDISLKMSELAKASDDLERASDYLEKTIILGRKIYIYGCGPTGRLAKQMESSFWRPFWRKIKAGPLWDQLEHNLPANVENLLIGEMTGADHALVNSLEGFEDLQLIGQLQLNEHKIEKGDMVFCVTEGGETSSVIGTILAAANQYGELTPGKIAEARNHLYFVYNNPDEVLLPLHRSKTVIAHPAITKILLFTGPQSITGSTRMQATTSETFVMGVILEHAIYRLLKQFLTATELASIGFDDELTIEQRLLSFIPLQKKVFDTKDILCRLTDLEAHTYNKDRPATYFAGNSLMTVFIDATERSSTFRLFPLDTVHEPKRKCWMQVWTPAGDAKTAWEKLLGRPFCGLDTAIYEQPFVARIGDQFLREAALRSLQKAGNDQQLRYDFSFSQASLPNRTPQAGDLGVAIISGAEKDELAIPATPLSQWLKLFHTKRANIGVIVASSWSDDQNDRLAKSLQEQGAQVVVKLPVPARNDPLGLRCEIGLKMLLNAHSTAVMAKLGRVIGNTMANVNPSNLKLIGRATFLIQSHVNDVLRHEEWATKYGKNELLTYHEANAVLFDAIEFHKRQAQADQLAEVAISIIRILESFKKQGVVSNEAAFTILQTQGLENYLIGVNPALCK